MNFYRTEKFIRCDAPFKNADLVLAGLPYDGTSSLRPGSRFAPNAIRKQSYSIETFSHEQERDLSDYKLCDLGDLEVPYGNSEAVVKLVEKTAAHMLKNKKKVIYIGGEHLLTYPLIKQYAKKYKDLKVIYFDAHADFREAFYGSHLSHASAAKLTADIVGYDNLFMFGIRSFERNEYNYMKKKKVFFEDNLEHFNEKVEMIKDHPVYMTLDMDVFDPACVPGLGTPEAGGIFYDDFVNMLPGLSKLNLVGMDVLEIAPDYDPHGNTCIFAAKVIRELILNTVEK
ncbi:MAG: agmatinase [Spirochaetia bacterium]|nr:agmatinase [Spirochaetia bacterium]